MATTPRLAVPYPAPTDPPDGSGGMYNLAKWLDDRAVVADRMCQAQLAGATDQPLTGNAWTDITNDGAGYDPLAMRQSDGVSFKVPYAGRWQLFVRATVTVDDVAGKWILGWYGVTVGTLIAARGQVGAFASAPFDFTTEEIIAANSVIKPQVFRSSTASNWIQHGQNNPSNICRSIIRYLGPN